MIIIGLFEASVSTSDQKGFELFSFWIAGNLMDES